MATSRSPIAVRLIAMVAGLSLLLASGACSTKTDGDVDVNGANTTITTSKTAGGAVAIFTPSDGITISQRTPLNKWAKLTPEIVDGLVEQGVAKGMIDRTTSDGIDAQSRAVQDWVVDHMTQSDDADGSVAPARTTLIVAPALSPDSSTRQYGDYVTQPDGSGDDEAADDGSSSSSGSSEASGSSGSSSDSSDDSDQAGYDRLSSALKLAKDAGMHVVLLANGVDGFTPDTFVRFSTPEEIGRLQATKLVTKLDLAKASKDNPKAIEVLIPYSPDSTGDGASGADAATNNADGGDASTSDGSSANSSDGSSDGTASDGSGESTDTSQSAQDTQDDAFAREAFAGMWKVLQPYFNQGKAYSPSGLLTKSTTDDDWRDVTVPDSDEKDIAAELDSRLAGKNSKTGRNGDKDDGSSSPTRIDGIIAMNDYVASVVIDELKTLGYTGSAADINPSITILGIVGNITGKKDLQRGAVPDPAKAPDSDGSTGSGDDSSQDADDDENSRWPIVTGFGGYVDTMPQVVNGKQWMTGLENRKAIAADIAEVTARLNRNQSVSGLKYVSKQTVPGSTSKHKVDTVTEEPLSVSAYNLKTALIDPGYISMADAGL
ncbi:hypothetical protein CSQ85_02120 [Bifidobacterium rousetti]|uniref:hypothetical protein n=1 Tax=Bifidobacterium rousetti TaxID=2045439 RepID=UPI001238C787|nr:hypothetical protein [Bifidobacterium rousetti]KAA8820598.1 hypothetical protein CSQ85_02120 [Bifidobacterium rousetti]